MSDSSSSSSSESLSLDEGTMIENQPGAIDENGQLNVNDIPPHIVGITNDRKQVINLLAQSNKTSEVAFFLHKLNSNLKYVINSKYKKLRKINPTIDFCPDFMSTTSSGAIQPSFIKDTYSIISYPQPSIIEPRPIRQYPQQVNQLHNVSIQTSNSNRNHQMQNTSVLQNSSNLNSIRNENQKQKRNDTLNPQQDVRRKGFLPPNRVLNFSKEEAKHQSPADCVQIGPPPNLIMHSVEESDASSEPDSSTITSLSPSPIQSSVEEEKPNKNKEQKNVTNIAKKAESEQVSNKENIPSTSKSNEKNTSGRKSLSEPYSDCDFVIRNWTLVKRGNKLFIKGEKYDKYNKKKLDSNFTTAEVKSKSKGKSQIVTKNDAVYFLYGGVQDPSGIIPKEICELFHASFIINWRAALKKWEEVSKKSPKNKILKATNGNGSSTKKVNLGSSQRTKKRENIVKKRNSLNEDSVKKNATTSKKRDSLKNNRSDIRQQRTEKQKINYLGSDDSDQTENSPQKKVKVNNKKRVNDSTDDSGWETVKPKHIETDSSDEESPLKQKVYHNDISSDAQEIIAKPKEKAKKRKDDTTDTEDEEPNEIKKVNSEMLEKNLKKKPQNNKIIKVKKTTTKSKIAKEENESGNAIKAKKTATKTTKGSTSPKKKLTTKPSASKIEKKKKKKAKTDEPYFAENFDQTSDDPLGRDSVYFKGRASPSALIMSETKKMQIHGRLTPPSDIFQDFLGSSKHRNHSEDSPNSSIDRANPVFLQRMTKNMSKPGAKKTTKRNNIIIPNANDGHLDNLLQALTSKNTTTPPIVKKTLRRDISDSETLSSD